MTFSRLLLAIACCVAPVWAQSPPEELFFGLTGLSRRIVYTPAPETVSGGLTFRLVEADRIAGRSGELVRLIVRCTSADKPLPGDLTTVGEPVALDDLGRELPLQALAAYPRKDALWLAYTFEAGSTSRCPVFTAAVGPPPQEIRRVARGDLQHPGEALHLATEETTLAVTLVRRERARLDLDPAGPPFFAALGSTLGRDIEQPPATEEKPYLSLRLHVLGALEATDGWRLDNLRVAGVDGRPVEDWRYVRRLWRPDWGGWLGVTGQDADGVGVSLTEFDAGSPALAGGLRKGDVVTALEGLSVRDAFSLGELVRRRAPGTALRLRVLRDGAPQLVTVKAGGRSLWPALDELEFKDAWARLEKARTRAVGVQDVLASWDWQAAEPLPAALEPKALELVFARTPVSPGTTFVFRRVPLVAPRR